MRFDLLGYRDKYKSDFGDTPLEDVAKFAYENGPFAKDQDYDTWKKAYGVDSVIQEEIKKKKPVETSTRGVTGFIADSAIDLVKGAVGLGESAVGLANLPTGNLVGDTLEKVGYDPKKTKEILSSWQSPERQAANKSVEEVSGFFETTKEYVKNPSALVGAILEAVPGTMTIAGGARTYGMKMLAEAGIKDLTTAAGQKAASDFLKRPSTILKLQAMSAALEGAQTTGSIQESARQEGQDWSKSVPYSVLAGVGTGGIAFLTSRIPGLQDAEARAAVIGLIQGTKGEALKETGKTIAKSFFKEGFLEEMPQSAQEQVFTNLALDLPWDQGVAEAAATGMLVGAVQGGAMTTGAEVIDRYVGSKAIDVEKLKAGIKTADTIYDGLTTGEVEGKPFTPADAVSLIQKGKQDGLYDEDDLEAFKNQYSQIRDDLNNIITSSIVDRMDQSLAEMTGEVIQEPKPVSSEVTGKEKIDGSLQTETPIEVKGPVTEKIQPPAEGVNLVTETGKPITEPVKAETEKIHPNLQKALQRPFKIPEEAATQIKIATKDTLTEKYNAGEIKDGTPIRFTSVDELRKVVEKEGLVVGSDFEGRPGISAQTMGKDTILVAYGPNNKVSAAIVFPEDAVEGKGEQANEVLMRAETPVEKLRFIIDGHKELLTFEQLKEVYRGETIAQAIKDKPAPATEVSTTGTTAVETPLADKTAVSPSNVIDFKTAVEKNKPNIPFKKGDTVSYTPIMYKDKEIGGIESGFFESVNDITQPIYEKYKSSKDWPLKVLTEIRRHIPKKDVALFNRTYLELKAQGSPEGLADIQALEYMRQIGKVSADMFRSEKGQVLPLPKTKKTVKVKLVPKVTTEMKPKTVKVVTKKAEPKSAVLPVNLAKAKPRYSYGEKKFTLKFDNDLDKAAYISAQRTKSKFDQDYVNHVMAKAKLTEADVRQHGKEIKESIKALAKDAADGTEIQVPKSSIPEYMVKVYHGTWTPDIEQFDTGYIGTGEGAQAFGWGLYFTTDKNVAKDYARRVGDYRQNRTTTNISIPNPIYNKSLTVNGTAISDTKGLRDFIYQYANRKTDKGRQNLINRAIGRLKSSDFIEPQVVPRLVEDATDNVVNLPPSKDFNYRISVAKIRDYTTKGFPLTDDWGLRIDADPINENTVSHHVRRYLAIKGSPNESETDVINKHKDKINQLLSQMEIELGNERVLTTPPKYPSSYDVLEGGTNYGQSTDRQYVISLGRYKNHSYRIGFIPDNKENYYQLFAEAYRPASHPLSFMSYSPTSNSIKKTTEVIIYPNTPLNQDVLDKYKVEVNQLLQDVIKAVKSDTKIQKRLDLAKKRLSIIETLTPKNAQAKVDILNQAEIDQAKGLKRDAEGKLPAPTHVIYEVHLHPDKDPSQYDYMDRDKVPLQRHRDKILKGIDKMPPVIRDKMKATVVPLFSKPIAGHQVYDAISEVLGSDKNASLWLNDQDIDGLTYIGQESGKRHFIVFNGNAASIKDKSQFKAVLQTQTNLPPIALKEVQTVFKGQEVIQPGGPNSPIYVKTRGGQYLSIESVSEITPNRLAFKIAYGRDYDPKIDHLAGVYESGNIMLVKGSTGRFELTHESVHFMEDVGVLDSHEVGLLKRHIQNLVRTGEFETSNTDDIGGKEDRANFIAQELGKGKSEGLLNRIMDRIRDFIDGLANVFGKRTVPGVVRDIQSGKIFEREGDLQKNNPALYALQQKLKPFFSQFENVVTKKMGGKMPVDQLIKMLKSNGVTDAEIDQIITSDLSDDKKVFTRQEVMDAITANTTEFKDDVFGEPTEPFAPSEYRPIRRPTFEQYRDFEMAADPTKTEEELRENYAIDLAHHDFNQDLVDRVNPRLPEPAGPGKYPQYEQFSEPGYVPGSYRELFVTATKRNNGANRIPTKEEFVEYYKNQGMGNTPSKLADLEFFYKEAVGKNEFEKGLLDSIGITTEAKWEDGHPRYSSVNNPIVRIRYNDRMIDGKKILFIEEMQGPSDANQDKMPEMFRKRIYDIGVKRVLALAKEGRYDGIAWTTGQMQADRYDLSKHVESVNWDLPGTRSEIADRMVWISLRGEGEEIQLEVKDGVILSDSKYDTFKGQKLEDVVGKEITKKVTDTETGELSGLDLKVGGQGLKKLYDKTLPSMFKKYGKESVSTIGLVSKLKWKTDNDLWYYETSIATYHISEPSQGEWVLAKGEYGGSDYKEFGTFKSLEEAKEAAENIIPPYEVELDMNFLGDDSYDTIVDSLEKAAETTEEKNESSALLDLLYDFQHGITTFNGWDADLIRKYLPEAIKKSKPGLNYVLKLTDNNGVTGYYKSDDSALVDDPSEAMKYVSEKAAYEDLDIIEESWDLNKPATVESVQVPDKIVPYIPVTDKMPASYPQYAVKDHNPEKILSASDRRNLERDLMANLSRKQIREFQKYSEGTEESSELNYLLRSEDELDPVHQKIIDAFDKGFQLVNPISRDIEVYRNEGDDLRIPNVGEVFTDKGYVSTSMDIQGHKLWDQDYGIPEDQGGLSVKILLPKGSKIIPLGKSLGYAADQFHIDINEGILPRNSKFKVLSKNKDQVTLQLIVDDKLSLPQYAVSRPSQPVPLPWDVDPPSRIDKFIRMFADRFIDLRKVVKAIEGIRGELADADDPSLQQTLYSAKVRNGLDLFMRDELRPMVHDLEIEHVSLEDFHTYILNRHAPEANAYIATINPDLPDGGSGVLTQDAVDYMNNLSERDRAIFEAAAEKYDAIARKNLQMLVENGLESQKTIDAWTAKYQYYAPLYRADMEKNGGMGTGKGFTVVGGASKARHGSVREVENVIASISEQRERYLVRIHKNNIDKALVTLAETYPNPEFWKLARPGVTERISAEPGQRGQMVKTVNMDYMYKDNVVMARTIDPKTGDVVQRGVEFNTDNERALQTVIALKNLDMDKLGAVLGLSAKVTRFISSMNTQYNPVFGIVNFVRDFQSAMLNLTSTGLAGKQLDIAKGVFPALKVIYQDLRSEHMGYASHSARPVDQDWADFRAHGGMVGYMDMYKTRQDRLDAIQKEMTRSTKGLSRQLLHQAISWLSDYNTTIESGIRFSAYKVAIQNGFTKDRAAALAKNLTLDFNKKGTVSMQAGALFAFFNATAQGGVRLYETYAGPAGKKIVAGGIMLGILQAMVLAAADFEDDEPPEFVKERGFIIPTGGGKYVAIPMPLGFHILPNIGRVTTEWAMSGFKKPVTRFANLFGLLVEAFNPMGTSGMSVQTITPTPLDPIIALAENKDWTGRRIYKEDYNPLQPTPGFSRAKDAATGVSYGISWALNRLSGGSQYKAGIFSPTPDQIDYLAGQVGGGVVRETIKTGQAVMNIGSKEELPTHKIPVVSRFYGSVDSDMQTRTRYYDILKEMNEHELEIKGLQKAGKSAYEYIKENPAAQFASAASQTDANIRKLNAEKRELEEQNASREVIKRVDTLILANMKRLNELYKQYK